jgi:hypothetical protein
VEVVSDPMVKLDTLPDCTTASEITSTALVAVFTSRRWQEEWKVFWEPCSLVKSSEQAILWLASTGENTTPFLRAGSNVGGPIFRFILSSVRTTHVLAI